MLHQASALSNRLPRELESVSLTSKACFAKYQLLQKIMTKYEIDAVAVQEIHARIGISYLAEENYKDLTCLRLSVIACMALRLVPDLLLKMTTYICST